VVAEEREQRLVAAALLFEAAADELHLASGHARRAAEHFRAGEIPRGAAHAWASLGHLRTGEERLVAQAQEHSLRSRL